MSAPSFSGFIEGARCFNNALSILYSASGYKSWRRMPLTRKRHTHTSFAPALFSRRRVDELLRSQGNAGRGRRVAVAAKLVKSRNDQWCHFAVSGSRIEMTTGLTPPRFFRSIAAWSRQIFLGEQGKEFAKKLIIMSLRLALRTFFSAGLCRCVSPGCTWLCGSAGNVHSPARQALRSRQGGQA